MPEYPFPFFGAGEADHHTRVEVHVRFRRAPGLIERVAIEAAVPRPLRDAVHWPEDVQLVVASELFLHEALIRAYPAKPGDLDHVGAGGRLCAAPSRVARFNSAVESWLGYAHGRCPILVAFREGDGEVRHSPWHHWSVAQLPWLQRELLPLAAPESEAEDGPAARMVRDIMALAQQAHSGR